MFLVMALISLALVAMLARALVETRENDSPEPLALAIAEHDKRLGELEGDLARKTISAEEAEVARAEIGRQLLREKKAIETTDAGRPASAPGRKAQLAAIAALGFLPLFAALIYSQTGQPGRSDMPLARRDIDGEIRAQQAATGSDAQLNSMLSELEARLQENPDEAEGWTILARAYEQQGDRANARRAWEGLLAAAPGNQDALWFLGVRAAQAGEPTVARAYWRQLQNQLDPLSEQFQLINQALETLPPSSR